VTSWAGAERPLINACSGPLLDGASEKLKMDDQKRRRLQPQGFARRIEIQPPSGGMPL